MQRRTNETVRRRWRVTLPEKLEENAPSKKTPPLARSPLAAVIPGDHITLLTATWGTSNGNRNYLQAEPFLPSYL